jgi:hypothetical protein
MEGGRGIALPSIGRHRGSGIVAEGLRSGVGKGEAGAIAPQRR